MYFLKQAVEILFYSVPLKSAKTVRSKKRSKTRTFVQIKKHPDGNFWVEKEHTFEEKMMYGSPRLL